MTPKHTVEFRQGYIQLHVTIEHADNSITDKPGGWVDSENGKLYAALCSCGEQAVGWSRAEAVGHLECSK